MENQSKKIEELENTLESANKHLQDNSILEMLRSSEWNEARKSFSTEI